MHPIFIKLLAGRTTAVEVDEHDTVECLKAKIEDQEGIPADQQRFTYAGKELPNNATLADFGVGYLATLSLSLRLLGGRLVIPPAKPEDEPPAEPAHGSPSEEDKEDKPPPYEEANSEANPELASAVNPELDLVFLCDATGSMGSYIMAAQQNISSIVDRVSTEHEADVRFALVSYRDHPPQDSTYITKVFDFSDDVDQMKVAVNTMSASGGGDGPEAVTAAMDDALRRVSWRPNSTKVAVLIADAPPHGLEPAGDGFPNGDPEGRDPLQIAREMAAHGITVYTVGCEPALGQYRHAREFMISVAEITGGQAIALSSAKLLADVIVNGSAEEVSLTRLQDQVESEIQAVQLCAEEAGESLQEEEVLQRACHRLQGRGVRSKQMRSDGAMDYNQVTKSTWKGNLERGASLAETKLELAKVTPAIPGEGRPMFRRASSRGARLSKAMESGAGMMASCMMRSACRVMSEDEDEECLEECLPHSMAMPPLDGEAPQYRSSTYNMVEEDAISAEQVSRLWSRSKAKSASRK